MRSERSERLLRVPVKALNYDGSQMPACFNCGHTNLFGQTFCGSCGSPLDLNAFINARVKVQLDASTRERDLVETESAIRVFEKALGWAKLVGYFCGLLLAGLVAGAAFWGYDLKQTATKVTQLGEATTANIGRVAAETSNNIQEQARSLRHNVTEAQNQVRGAVELAPQISSLQGHLSQAQKRMSQQQKQIASAEQRIVEQQMALSAQQRRISNSENFEAELVRKTLANHRELVFNLPRVPQGKYLISDEPQGPAIVYFLLPSSPVPDSLQISVGSTPASPISVHVLHNLVAMASPKPRSEILSELLSVSYFADSADQTAYQTISALQSRCCTSRLYADGHLEVDGLLIDGTPLKFLNPINAPVIGGIAPYEEQ